MRTMYILLKQLIGLFDEHLTIYIVYTQWHETTESIRLTNILQNRCDMYIKKIPEINNVVITRQSNQPI